MGSCRASVLIVAYNSREDLPDCLDAVVPTLGPDDELLIYDSGSTDGGAAVAQARGVRVCRSADNLGFGGGNNRAAALSRGRWLVFLNPDTNVEPGWLDALLAPLLAAPGLATSKIVLMDDPGRIDTCANAVHLSGVTTCRGHGQSADRFDRTERVLAVSGAAFAIDRDSFEQLGGFDETFFMYLEDTDLSLRAAVAGLPIWFVPGSRVRHRHAPSVGPAKLHWLERNRYQMLLKAWSPRTLLGLAPMLALVELLVLGFALLTGPAAVRAKLSTWPWLARHAWRIVAARRRAQRGRRVDDRALLAACTWRLDLAELVASGPLRRALEVGALVPFGLAYGWLRLVASTASYSPSSRSAMRRQS